MGCTYFVAVRFDKRQLFQGQMTSLFIKTPRNIPVSSYRCELCCYLVLSSGPNLDDLLHKLKEDEVCELNVWVIIFGHDKMNLHG